MSNIGIINLNGGEYTPKIDTRSDTEKYVSGCRTLQNMIPIIFGGVEKRPGTEFITSKATFSTMLASIVAHENIGVCFENSVVNTDFDSILTQIICWENAIMCFENEIVAQGGLDFLSRALCFNNSVVFHENETVFT